MEWKKCLQTQYKIVYFISFIQICFHLLLKKLLKMSDNLLGNNAPSNIKKARFFTKTFF